MKNPLKKRTPKKKNLYRVSVTFSRRIYWDTTKTIPIRGSNETESGFVMAKNSTDAAKRAKQLYLAENSDTVTLNVTHVTAKLATENDYGFFNSFCIPDNEPSKK